MKMRQLGRVGGRTEPDSPVSGSPACSFCCTCTQLFCRVVQRASEETISSGNIFLQDFKAIFFLGRTAEIPHGSGLLESVWVVQNIIEAGKKQRYR